MHYEVKSVDEEPASSLVAAMRDEIAGIYEGVDLEGPGMPTAGPADLSPPSGTFLVGFDDSGGAICCGGIKRLHDDVCEIKRMYVVPDARASGRAGELLRALEQAARDLGYRIARLDTGPDQPHARRLYEQAGYREIENFNGNPMAAFFGEKLL